MKKLGLELTVVLGATLAANLLISPHAPGWVGLQPHPYLIPIALVASRYGSLAAGALTLVLFGLYEMASGGANPLQAPHAAVWACCILDAAVIGALFDQYRHRHHEMQKDLSESQLQLKLVRQQSEVLESAVAELRSRILGAGETFGSLYGLARQLTTLSPEQLYSSCLELACKQTEASQAHFFLIEEGALVAVAHYPPDSLPKMNPEQSKLVQLAMETGKLVTAHGQSQLAGPLDPLVVVPLGGDIGLLTFDNLPFRRFHPTTLAELESIGDWTARAMSQLKRYREKEHRVAEGHAAHLHLLEKLNDIPLQPRDLPLMEAIAEPMMDLLLQTLTESRWKPLLRSNLLLILERIPLDASQQGQLAAFVSTEIAWVRQAQRDLHGLIHQAEALPLTLLQAYLRRNLALRRNHLVRAQALISPIGQALWEPVLQLPVAQPVSATLHGLSRLAQSGQRIWTELGPGTPASLALELTRHPHAQVREAAFWCVAGLNLPEKVRLEACARAAADADPLVRRVGL